MNTTGKWLARAGALLVIVGFVLPSMMVSCSLAPGVGQSFSLANLASFADQYILYLVPLGALAVLILSFFPTTNRSAAKNFLIGQVVGLAVSILSIIIAILTVSTQLNQMQAFQVTPDYGMIALLGGYILCIAGFIVQGREMGQKYLAGAPYPAEDYQAIPPPQGAFPQPEPYLPPGPVAPTAYLEVIRGVIPPSMIPVYGDNFTIGRSSKNTLNVPDSTVSRSHARIRYAQNSWFLQDVESTGGTFVNGREVSATRLNSGDQIKIGETTFIFHG